MEEDKLKESKKVLTDYMLELNADIQRAEDWVNTGADEEMYFALKTVLDRLEQLEKENKPLEYNNATLEKQVKLMRYNFKIAVEQEVKENYIPKSVIREKIEELESKRKKYFNKDLSKAQFVKSMKMWGAICYLKELLGGSNE